MEAGCLLERKQGRASLSSNKKYVVLDFETTGKNPRRDKVFAFAFGDLKGNVEVVRPPDAEPLKQLKNKVIIGHNIKFDLHFLEGLIGKHDWKIEDTLIMSRLIRNLAPNHSLDALGKELFDYPDDYDRLVKRYIKQGYDKVPEDIMTNYQIADIQRTALLFRAFYPIIKRDHNEIYAIEKELVITTLRIEQRGIGFDRKKALEMIKELSKRSEAIPRGFDMSSKFGFNPDRPSDVSYYLFNQLGLKPLGYTKTGRPRLDKEALSIYLNDPSIPEKKKKYVKLLLEYRAVSRARKMIENYLEFAEGDIIYPTINTLQARTGRESSSEPNLQNVNRSETLLNPFQVPLRKLFKPKNGFWNFHLDYKGIEARLLAEYSGDEKMIEMFKNGEDVHSFSAKLFYGKRFEQANPQRKKVLRSSAKNTNFAIGYGGSVPKFAETLNLPVNEVSQKFLLFKSIFPKYVSMHRRIIDQLGVDFSVKTAFGRKLYIARDKPHSAVNYLIQGTASDLIKVAQNRIYKFLEEFGELAGIILPIHDEIVIEIHKSLKPQVRDILMECRRLMTTDLPFTIPIEVDIEIAKESWDETQPFPI